MTDKEKLIAIRTEVERRVRILYGTHAGRSSDVLPVLEELLSFIDSMQKEPTGNPLGSTHAEFRTAVESLGISQEEYDRIVDALIYGKEPELVDADDLPTKKDYRERYKRIAESEEFRKNHDGMSIGDIVPVVGEEPVSIDFEQELYKAFGQVKDFTLGMQIAKWFYDMGRKYHEPVSEELEKVVEEIVDPTVLNAYGVKEIANRLRRTMKEPVSEELEEAAKNHAVERYRTTRNEELAEKCKWSFKAGAKWQKEKEYTCYEEAFEDGAAWKKEQMMAKAIDVEVKVDAGGYPYIDKTIELYDYDKDVPLAKEGDKYKVVLIKED